MKLKRVHIIGAIFTTILGTLLHFLYQWSDKNEFIATFSAVNESTWEHLKLLITPFILFLIIEYFLYGKNKINFFFSKFVSLLVGMIAIVIIFYTYSGIVGKNYIIADILTFIIGVFISYFLSYYFITNNWFDFKDSNTIGAAGLMLLIACMIIFTFNPPGIALFKDPVTDSYGI